MVYLYLFFLLLSIMYFVQIVLSMYVYYTTMKTLKDFNLIYKNNSYLNIAKIIFLIFLLIAILFAIFKTHILTILLAVLSQSTFKYLKKFYTSIIMANDTLIYNGVGVIKKDAINKVFIEEGRNLEKKYNFKYKGFDKFLKNKYIVFELKSKAYVLVKNYDEKYLQHIMNIFVIN